MPSCNRLSYSNEQKLFRMKLFKESHFSGEDAKLVPQSCSLRGPPECLKAREFYVQFEKKKGYNFICVLFSNFHFTILSTYTYVLLCRGLTSFLRSYNTGTWS